MSRLCATVLIMEAIVLALSIPVAIQIDHLAGAPAGIVGGIAAVAAIVFAVLARRMLRVTLVGGSLLQLYAIVSGIVVPVMYFLGAIFALLWIIGIVLGIRMQRPANP